MSTAPRDATRWLTSTAQERNTLLTSIVDDIRAARQRADTIERGTP